MHIRKTADNHVDEEYCRRMLIAGDVLGINVFCVSDLELSGDVRYETFHVANDRVRDVVARYPDRFKGYCFVNPGDRRALDEIKQRVKDEGFIGVKLYNQYRIDEPVCDAVLKLASDWQIPILVHAGHVTDLKTIGEQPRISDAGHFAAAAKRYPDALLIEAHIGGGGDWEWAIKHLRDAPSVWVDTSGSGVDEEMIDRCTQEIGVDRLLFGTDMSMEAGVGKILDATLTEKQRQLIFGENFANLLARRNVP